MDILATTVPTALISSVFMQWLKKSKWFSFIGTDRQHQTANFIFSMLMAAVTSLGISYHMDSAQHTFVIGGLDPTSILNHLGMMASQWAQQHVLYKFAVVPTEMQGFILQELKTLAASLQAQVKQPNPPPPTGGTGAAW